MICGTDVAMVNLAVAKVQEIVKVFEVGEVIKGKVVRLMDFGAFIALNSNQDGMAHVSELAPYRINKPADFVSVGDIVTVKIKEIDDQGRINLTLKGLEDNQVLWKDEKGKSTDSGSFGGSRPGGFTKRPGSFGGPRTGTPAPRV